MKKGNGSRLPFMPLLTLSLDAAVFSNNGCEMKRRDRKREKRENKRNNNKRMEVGERKGIRRDRAGKSGGQEEGVGGDTKSFMCIIYRGFLLSSRYSQVFTSRSDEDEH